MFSCSLDCTVLNLQEQDMESAGVSSSVASFQVPLMKRGLDPAS